MRRLTPFNSSRMTNRAVAAASAASRISPAIRQVTDMGAPASMALIASRSSHGTTAEKAAAKDDEDDDDIDDEKDEEVKS